MKLLNLISRSMGATEYSKDGELFGQIAVPFPITPDDAAGRLLIRNTSGGRVLLRPCNGDQKTVYEALIKSIDHEKVVVTLSQQFCSEIGLGNNSVEVDVQFQINRTPLCEMHDAIDRLGPEHGRILFPTVYNQHPQGEVNSIPTVLFFILWF